jgi:hypothetical protein
MNIKYDGSWEGDAQGLITKFRTKAKGINNFTALEDLALEEGRKLTQMLLQGGLIDKGDGADIALPHELKITKPKNKGLKKKDLAQDAAM